MHRVGLAVGALGREERAWLSSNSPLPLWRQPWSFQESRSCAQGGWVVNREVSGAHDKQQI